MFGVLVSWIFLTIGILIVAYFLPGVSVRSLSAAIWAAAVLGLLNTFVKPILVILTLPITIITVGLFLLVINALLFLLVGSIVPGFEVRNFWWALLGSIIVSILSYVRYRAFD